ncbi:MAG: thiamine-phosphate kinase [Methanotrichaceae archaeon]|nr:thiamine-phosphate kinase [Methanotrichaceae archaeon]
MPQKCSDLGERALIRRISKILGGVEQDDCAVIDLGEDFLVVSTDMLHRETDFPEAASPWQMGWMSAAVNLSDIAAMGAMPLGLLIAVGLPGDLSVDLVDGLFSGLRDCASAFGTVVLGGDTDSHQELTVCGTALGRVEKDLVLRRRGARPGDIVCTTGALGGAGGGLKLLSEGGEGDLARRLLEPREEEGRALALSGAATSMGGDGLARRLLEPQPRLVEGRALALSGAVTSMMDNSDGLALSLHDLAHAGGAGFLIREEDIPIDPKVEALFPGEALDLALHAGGDFELLFTVRPDRLEEAEDACPLTQIGIVVDSGVWMEGSRGRQRLEARGYQHL